MFPIGAVCFICKNLFIHRSQKIILNKIKNKKKHLYRINKIIFLLNNIVTGIQANFYNDFGLRVIIGSSLK